MVQIGERCEDERWPVRIMMCFTKALMEDSDLISRDKLKIKHSFSHYNLDIDSLILKFGSDFSKKLGNNQMWFDQNDLKSVGTPSPVTKIIDKVI